MFGVSERSKSVEHHVNNSKSNVVFNPDSFGEAEVTLINRPERILVVDDDHTILNILYTALTALKLEVKVADNAYDALDIFINKGSALILSDIQMPGMDGWELASSIKKISPETSVILMTGMDKDQVQEQIKNGHADFVLYKPFSLNHLKTLISDLRGSGMIVSGDLHPGNLAIFPESA